ncbi:MAG TPA: response regulator transcription factor [Cellvibrionaceae bacterium]
MNIKSLLIVDDDSTFAEIMQQALQKRGYKVAIAHNCNQALRTIRQTKVSHVLLDLKLGNESGLALMGELLAENPALCIVILTGYSSISTAVSAIKNGAHHYLCKPVNADEVLAAFDSSHTEVTPDLPQQPHSVERLTWEYIQKVLQENHGNISATARSLGMHRRTLQRKLGKRPVKQ